MRIHAPVLVTACVNSRNLCEYGHCLGTRVAGIAPTSAPGHRIIPSGKALVYSEIAQRRHHYEHAFEEFLRARRIPYVAVDEAKKALLPESASLVVQEPDFLDPAAPPKPSSLKSFDFVLYGKGSNLLVEVKGRRISRPRRRPSIGPTLALGTGLKPPPRARLDSWATYDDIESLTRWQALFGPEFEAALVFVYWCDEQPPDALFEEIYEHRGRWYAIRAVTLAAYSQAMKVRSPRWRTVHVPPSIFERISRPLAGSFVEGSGVGTASFSREVAHPEPAIATLGT